MHLHCLSQGQHKTQLAVKVGQFPTVARSFLFSPYKRIYPLIKGNSLLSQLSFSFHPWPAAALVFPFLYKNCRMLWLYGIWHLDHNMSDKHINDMLIFAFSDDTGESYGCIQTIPACIFSNKVHIRGKKLERDKKQSIVN